MNRHLEEEFADWLKSRRVGEVECLVPDMGGIARGKILGGLFEASLFVEYRLPELFCGFARLDGGGPVPYPVACSPQSWSAAAVFLLVQAILGMKIEAAASRLSFIRPMLPEFLDRLEVKNLKVGEGAVDVMVHRRARHPGRGRCSSAP